MGCSVADACSSIGISRVTYYSWRSKDNLVDMRLNNKPPSKHWLPEDTRKKLLSLMNSPTYCDLSPPQIEALLADKGIYLASSSTMYRILAQNGLLKHRGRTRPARQSKPKELAATGPNQLWTWDISYLRTTVTDKFFYLYVVVDVFSRKMIGWHIDIEQTAELGSAFLNDCCKAESISANQLTIHSDNGGAMRGTTTLQLLAAKDIQTSFSRTRCSNDNPYSESLFNTIKYNRKFGCPRFGDIDSAREWMSKVCYWYNYQHLHSAIKYVTPIQRHNGLDKAIMAKRQALFNNKPNLTNNKRKDWSYIEVVKLNHYLKKY